MPSRSSDYRFIVVLVAIVVVAYCADRWMRKRPTEVNPHDPTLGRIESFELQPGEVGVAVRVLWAQQPAQAATVWADWQADDDEAPARHRQGQTDQTGLARVPVHKGSSLPTRLFVRDKEGHLGGGMLSGERMLSAADIVLVEIGPRKGRLVSTDGQPIARATVTAQSFSHEAHEDRFSIDVPQPVQPEYTVQTDARGQFSLPGVPVGFSCWLAFRTTGYGEGRLWLPAGANGEFRLAPAGSVRVRIAGDGTCADVAGLDCYLHFANPQDLSLKQMRVDGQRVRRHGGMDAFEVPNIVPGKYVLGIRGTPQNPVLPLKAVRVTVDSGSTAEVQVPLGRAGRLVGRVVDGESGEGLQGVRLGTVTVSLGMEDTGYGGKVLTDDTGRFAAWVPPGVPVALAPQRCPPGYQGPHGPPLGQLREFKPQQAAAGETRTLPDFKFYRQGAITGTVVAEGQPVPEAAVELRWGSSQHHEPVTLKTDAAGKFRVSDAPPAQPAAIRVRAGAMVNAVVAFEPDQLLGPLTIPISAGNAFRIRGQVVNGQNHAVERAKVVIEATIPSLAAEPLQNDEGKVDEAPVSAEVEAVFSDAEGRFESGPLWPGCLYFVSVSAEGLTPRQLRNMEGKAGRIQELHSIVLKGTSATVNGIVHGPDGQPLAGAVVLNSGDAPRLRQASSEERGRFSLRGLYDGPAVIVAHKSGYRWGYALAQAGAAEPIITLRPQTEPPAPILPRSDEHRRAEAELVCRLTEIIGKHPEPPARKSAAKDPWAEARKDLDGYLAKQTREPGESAVHNLTSLARALGKEDRTKALRVLREAAALAKRLKMPADQPMAALLGQGADLSATLRVSALAGVAEAALDLADEVDAAGWLAEAEEWARQMPEFMRAHALVHLAAAWVTLDPARTEKLLAGAASPSADMITYRVVERLLQKDPAQAIPWLDRFPHPDDATAQSFRSRIATGLADRDPSRALQLARGIRHPAYRGLTLARLATKVPRDNPKQAHKLIAEAAQAIDEPAAEDDEELLSRMGVAIFLLWQAEAVSYPDRASLVALALSSRPPVPVSEAASWIWLKQTLRLAAGIASVDPATGRALLRLGLKKHLDDLPDRQESSSLWLMATALADPAAALQYVNKNKPDPYVATGILQVLNQRSSVIERLQLLDGAD